MEEKNLEDIISAIYKHRKKILVTTVVSMVIVAIITLFLPNYYKSNTVFFVMSPDISKPEFIFGSSTGVMHYYGGEDDVDRIFTIARNQELILHLVDSFSLYERYNIKPDSPKSKYKVQKKFLNYYKVQKTEFGGIELSFEDKDPEIATSIANAAKEYINYKATELLKDVQRSTLNVLRSDMDNKRINIINLSDSLQVVRQKYGIFNTESQSEGLSSKIANTQSTLIREKGRLKSLSADTRGSMRDSITLLSARVSGLENELNALLGNDTTSIVNIQKFNEGQGVFDILTDQLVKSTTELSYQGQRLLRVESALNSNFNAILTFEAAEVPEVKSRPVRSRIVLVAGVLIALLSILYVIFLEFFGGIQLRKSN